MDEGVDPTSMCERLVLSMKQEAEIQTLAPPGIRLLFEDWMGQLENEVVTFLKGKKDRNPEVLAKEFKISVEGADFLMKKLGKEGRI